ncbi:SIS domain-containing protein [Curtobacterium sp. MCBD17_028]|uniref:SIS domain-containing protein n=1 Tax=Curtobacterium sp. MCBD17_028 TaxID=2175670 RepID=UPI000DA863AA|nr:SIS domain-containing protein [Curtobacterium sp. MCBD17_028]PZE22927.1 glutamine--fructose-6-phosphate aminotransferase [Curtobacterium sp. MCBD17_028]
MTEITPFEADILEQPAALRRLAAAGPAAGIERVTDRPWDRVVLTGMGSSHFAGIPTWRALVAAGVPAWSVDTGQLLDTPELVTPSTLVVATSQSGASGEVVELLDRIGAGSIRPGAVVGIADDATSPLAVRADVHLALHSGPEATVSTKSYVNTLAVQRAVALALGGGDTAGLPDDLTRIADTVEDMLSRVDLGGFARATVAEPGRRVAMVGRGDDAATALLSGLITKESSKVAAEGHVGGQFRHGPFELAGPGLTTVLYGVDESEGGAALQRLGADLVATGARVLTVGTSAVDGATAVPAPRSGPVEGLVTGAVVAEFLAVAFARAAGVVPGAFAYGSKVTTAL